MDTHKVLYPGREVQLKSGAVARVFPVSFKHFNKFSAQIARLASAASQTPFTKGAAPDVIAKQMGTALLPLLLNEALELMADCVIMEPVGEVVLDDLPHWEIAPIVAAWIEESFGTEEKIRPWMEAVNRVIALLPEKPASTPN